eukprot:scaffold527868_cov47-Prasinocladus_malaysianus.AAC.1
MKKRSSSRPVLQLPRKPSQTTRRRRGQSSSRSLFKQGTSKQQTGPRSRWLSAPSAWTCQGEGPSPHADTTSA